MSLNVSTGAPDASEKSKLSLIERKEALLEEVMHLNLLSNVFMSVALRDIPACQYVVRILMGDDKLIVTNVRTQYYIPHMTSRDAQLDVLAEREDGKIINIEIQRADDVDHAKRARFYASLIDSEYMEKGKTFEELPDVTVIYISETDIWNDGRTLYTLEKRFRETGREYNDGRYTLYVNAQVDDGSTVADLMKYFKDTDPDDMSHGELSERVRRLKKPERGGDDMRDIGQELVDIGREEGREEGMKRALRSTARNMHKDGLSDALIAKYLGVSVEAVPALLTSQQSDEPCSV